MSVASLNELLPSISLEKNVWMHQNFSKYFLKLLYKYILLFYIMVYLAEIRLRC